MAQGLTDVDDKIIAKAAAVGEHPGKVAQRYEHEYAEAMSRLNVRYHSSSRSTDNRKRRHSETQDEAQSPDSSHRSKQTKKRKKKMEGKSRFHPRAISASRRSDFSGLAAGRKPNTTTASIIR